MTPPVPPKLAVGILRTLLPADWSEEILQNLALGFEERLGAGWSRYRARRWYWRQTLGPAMWRLVVLLRARRRNRGKSPNPDPKKNPQRGIFGPLESAAQDIRFAVRTLFHRPVYASVAIITLGLGIGAATAMFSVVDAVLLADVQYREPDRLMTIWQRIEGREGYTEAGEIRLMYHQYEALREQSSAWEDVAVYAGDWGESTLGGGSRPELVEVGPATASLVPVLGITPVLGRWFLPEEEGEGAGDRARVTVMSHDMWSRRFAEDPQILGTAVLINGISYTVIGVLPSGFRLQWLSASLSGADDPGQRDFWVPVGSPEWDESPGSTMWEAVGRLANGATLEQARIETSRILKETWSSQQPDALIRLRVREEVRGLGSPILLLFGATGLLLLIACGNVAALSLGEMHGRTQEIATRAAIGAGRLRIGRQLITESVVLGFVASAFGALLALLGSKLLVAYAPPIARIDQVEVNLVVLGFSAGLGTLSGALFGLAPAVFIARTNVSSTLKAGGRTGSARHGGWGRWVLAGEIAFTVILLVASGLLAQSLTRMFSVDLGFDPRNLATVQVDLPDARYGWEMEGAAWSFANEVMREMTAIPGVEAVSASQALPFPDNPSEWAVRTNPEDSTYLMPELYNVAPGYLDFMGIPILEGRGFLSSDDREGPPVAVVGRSLARALWGDRSPVGQEMIYPHGTVTVVGVAGDTRQATLQRDPPLTFYVPFAQLSRYKVTFAARASDRPEALLPQLREAVWHVDAQLAVSASGTLESAIAESASEERFRALLMTLFAFLATALAAVGIAGLTARQVSRQAREIGIMKALGAEDSALLGGVIRRAAVTGAVGVTLGLVGAFWLRPLISALLFGIGSFDLLTYVGIGTLFLLVSVVAGYVPARRLVRVDPVSVLGAE
ncbi:MAG: ABC transporter permease [Gemmatimonadota bacterium]|jgi:putative ABC transport system permease protein